VRCDSSLFTLGGWGPAICGEDSSRVRSTWVVSLRKKSGAKVEIEEEQTLRASTASSGVLDKGQPHWLKLEACRRTCRRGNRHSSHRACQMKRGFRDRASSERGGGRKFAYWQPADKPTEKRKESTAAGAGRLGIGRRKFGMKSSRPRRFSTFQKKNDRGCLSALKETNQRGARQGS